MIKSTDHVPASGGVISPLEHARVAVATSTLNTASRIGRRFGDPLASLDAPGGPDDRLALFRSMIASGPLLRSKLGPFLTASHAGCHAVFTSPHASSLPASRDSVFERLFDPTVTVGRSQPLSGSFIEMDAPDHTRLRRLVQRGFTPKSITAHHAVVCDVADELIASFPRRGPVDLVDAFARPLPMRVIARLMGVPADDLRRFDAWGDGIVAALDRPRSRGQAVEVFRVTGEIDSFFRGLVADRRRSPGDDLVSVLAEQADGDVLTDDELVGTLSLLLIAGFETTVNLIGTGTSTLVANPDQLQRLASDPDQHLANTVEEALRFETPVQFTFRRARAPIEVAPGHVVPEGDEVITVIGAANRDPAVFDHPDRFDIARPNARRHLAFVTGPHACLGGALARLEAATAWRSLLDAFGDVDRWRVVGEPVAGASQIIRGWRHLPMSFA